MIVYVVTTGTGEYRKFEAIFDNRKQAAYYCAIKNSDETRIEEWDTDGLQFTGSKTLLSCWSAFVTTNKEIRRLTESFTFDEENDCEQDGSGWDISITTEFGMTEDQARAFILDRFDKMSKK